jgi:hypothetical protein
VHKRFDKASTLRASEAPKSANASPVRGWLASSALIAFGAALCLISIKASEKKIDTNNDVVVYQISVKTYAAQKIASNKQWSCLSKLYGKESAWNPDAVSGSHYGIPQLKNPLMKGLDPYRQIDYGLKYIKHRYKLDELGYINACAAWNHFERKNWH